ncbi:LysR family transcriptional regulator, partial [Pseudomonas aeruginosa]
PAVNLLLQTPPSGELVEWLLGGRHEALQVDGPLDFDGLEGLPKFEERMVLVTENGLPRVRGRVAVAGSAVCDIRPR